MQKLLFCIKFPSQDFYVECTLSPPFILFFPLSNVPFRLKNQATVDPDMDETDEKLFHDVEMMVDERNFDGDSSKISPGQFVSFKYLGEYNAFGPPIHPIISYITVIHAI